MGKKVVVFLTCFAIIFSGLQINCTVKEVAAAQFTGTHFAMEFSGHDSANMEKANGWSNGGMFNCTWIDSNVNFSNDGIMSLTINSNGSGGYTGGEYRTRQTFGYGMYQVSMKPIKNPGVVTSFFTYTGPTDGTIWDEIDIEFLGYDTTKVQFNYFTNGVGEHEYLYDLGFDASQSFHTYGFYWGPGTITWYVDGNPVYTVNSSDVPVTPGKIMMNVWPGTGVDSWLKPYNGVTPLTGYYDWAVYDAPGAGSEPTQPPTTQPPTTTTVNDGYTALDDNAWKSVSDQYSLYAGSWNNGSMRYKGTTDNDLALKVVSSSGSPGTWGLQAARKNTMTKAGLQEGKKYKLILNYHSTSAGTMLVKVSDNYTNTYAANVGNNRAELEFTYSSALDAGISDIDSVGAVLMELSGFPAGTVISNISVSYEALEENTTTENKPPVDSKPAAPNGLTYAGNDNLPYYFAWQAVDGAEYYNLYVNGNLASTGIVDVAHNVDASEFLTAGEYTIGVTAVVGGVESDMATTKMTFEAATQPTTQAPTTEAPTTVNSSKIVISDDVNIEGYQISTTSEGSRVIGSVEPKINGLDVNKWGFVYAIEKAGDSVFSVPDDEMYVGTNNEYITSLESTQLGTSDVVLGDSTTATYFIRTTLFSTKNEMEFNAKYKVRAYALLSDGSYVYSDVSSYSVFDIGDRLYQNKLMNSFNAHEYLYNNLLTIVNPTYKKVDYDWSNTVIKP